MPTRSRSHRRTPRPSSARRTASRASHRPDALRILKEDHARVKTLFDKFEHTRGETARGALADRICEELKLHAQLEEEIFYPPVREAIEDDDLMNEAEVEHASAKDLIGQIEACRPSDPRFGALVTVLREYIQHHVKEEEGEMFEKIRRSALDRVALGERMQEWKAGSNRRGKGRLASLLGA